MGVLCLSIKPILYIFQSFSHLPLHISSFRTVEWSAMGFLCLLIYFIYYCFLPLFPVSSLLHFFQAACSSPHSHRILPCRTKCSTHTLGAKATQNPRTRAAPSPSPGPWVAVFVTYLWTSVSCCCRWFVCSHSVPLGSLCLLMVRWACSDFPMQFSEEDIAAFTRTGFKLYPFRYFLSRI